MARRNKTVHETDKPGADANRDPITGEPGAHPVGTGLGTAAGGAAAGAAAGLAAGPVGAAVGAVVGGVAGGLAGKGIAESINPTVEEAYCAHIIPSDRTMTGTRPMTNTGQLMSMAGSREGGI